MRIGSVTEPMKEEVVSEMSQVTGLGTQVSDGVIQGTVPVLNT